jgi:thiamine pyrophosphate-dependent acetolactate synthase large subunit-like protein
VHYAVAAKIAYPVRCDVALVGDGTMQMNGNAELLTVAKYWKRWTDSRLVVAVAHNNDLNGTTTHRSRATTVRSALDAVRPGQCALAPLLTTAARPTSTRAMPAT